MRSLGLYIHIPFCKAKCIYCDFYSLPRAEGQMDAYVSALTVQLAAWRERAADCTVDTVYFGGGTPSYLGPDRLRRLLDRGFSSYRSRPGAGVTLEANPTARRIFPPCGSCTMQASTASRSGCSPRTTRSCGASGASTRTRRPSARWRTPAPRALTI